MHLNIKYIFLLVTYVLSCNFIQSQVTIGSRMQPATGALLDLKEFDPDENNVTSKKGLLLPRVTLSDLYSLVDIKDGDSNSPSAYTGMIVYNSVNTDNECATIPSGLYVWKGDQWISLGDETIDKKPSGSFIDDLKTLNQIQIDNPNSNIQYRIDLDNPNNNPLVTNEYKFSQVCGENRLVEIHLVGKTNLNTIDASGADALEILSFTYSDVETLNVSKNKRLKTLEGGDSKISSLDISNNPELNVLYVQKTQLKSLDISNNMKLKNLFVYNNKDLKSLDVSQHTDLLDFKCFQTGVDYLDVTNSKGILILYVEDVPRVRVCRKAAIKMSSMTPSNLGPDISLAPA